MRHFRRYTSAKRELEDGSSSTTTRHGRPSSVPPTIAMEHGQTPLTSTPSSRLYVELCLTYNSSLIRLIPIRMRAMFLSLRNISSSIDLEINESSIIASTSHNHPLPLMDDESSSDQKAPDAMFSHI
ncbi:hypothetical protein M513_09044 [Trichuris suis]|uniref:Uncharacterized protein n=1 Tax=Trichuris suis TaxID=68888 RepID=A0A085LYN8_9BILA|nr:hypothetical protein M513_09044 [Trichuris suis]